MSSNSTNIDPAILTSILGEKRASEKYAKLGLNIIHSPGLVPLT